MPLANRLDDGFSTKIAFSLFPSIEFYEKDVTLPGFDGGSPIDTTTMRNTLYRTFSPRALITLTPMSITAAYTSAAYNVSTGLLPMLNKNGQITVTLPDNATYVFWGMLISASPGPMSEGNQPTMNLVIHPSNTNNSKAETAPVFTP